MEYSLMFRLHNRLVINTERLQQNGYRNENDCFSLNNVLDFYFNLTDDWWWKKEMYNSGTINGPGNGLASDRPHVII